MTPAVRTNGDIVSRAIDALNDRDREAFADVHATDVVLHDHGETVHGLDALVDHEWAIFDAFPDAHYSLDDVVVEDDTIAARWTATGTHDGEFRGIAPTGESIEIVAYGMFRVADGVIVEVWLTTDRLGLLQQLGVVDAPTA